MYPAVYLDSEGQVPYHAVVAVVGAAVPLGHARILQIPSGDVGSDEGLGNELVHSLALLG